MYIYHFFFIILHKKADKGNVCHKQDNFRILRSNGIVKFLVKWQVQKNQE